VPKVFSPESTSFACFHSFCLSTLQIMNKVTAYFKDSYQELVERVTWPTSQQLQQSTVIVLVATLIITLMVTLMDFGSAQLLKLVYSLFKA
jgi:preprotein translocase subunit SecE